MASPLVVRPPTCLSCLRRIMSINPTGSVRLGLTQVRGKKTEGRLKSPGVVVRLLKDVPQFGKEGSIFRLPAGRMRNHFFPSRKAEYMTRARFAELGLTKNDVGERDFTFRPALEQEELFFDDAVDAIANGGALPAGVNAFAPALEAPKRQPAMEVEQLAPNRALELMNKLIPQVIVFERRLVHPDAKAPAALPVQEAKEEPAPEPEKAESVLSPMQAHRAKLLEAEKAAQQSAGQDPAEASAEAKAEAEAKEMTPEELEALQEQRKQEAVRKAREKRERQRLRNEAEKHLKIHGGITKDFLAMHFRELMLLDAEASRIQVQPGGIKFSGVDNQSKLDKVGSYEVVISTRVNSDVEPVKRTIKIVARQGQK